MNKLLKKFLTMFTVALVAVCCCMPFTSCFLMNGEQSSQPPVEYVTVTFNMNYDGSTAQEKEIEKGSKVQKITDPTRDGFDFSGWYTAADCAQEFNFDSTIESDTTVYAGWLDNSVTYYKLTFNYNYEGAPEADVQYVAAGEKGVKPADPVVADKEFASWTTTVDGATAFDFNTEITADTTVYAQWKTTYVFEAEYVDLSELRLCGWSGNPSDPMAALCYSEDKNLGISNGYFLTYLYRDGSTLAFNIVSDREVKDAKIILRLSAEGGADFSLDGNSYTLSVNGLGLAYDEISFTEIPPLPDCLPFKDFEVAVNVKLLKGNNKIELITTNTDALGGTTQAKAPLVDCMKISTSAVLTWEPVTSNTEGGLD